MRDFLMKYAVGFLLLVVLVVFQVFSIVHTPPRVPPAQPETGVNLDGDIRLVHSYPDLYFGTLHNPDTGENVYFLYGYGGIMQVDKSFMEKGEDSPQKD